MRLIIFVLLLGLAIGGCVNTKRLVLESAYATAVMNSGKPFEEIRSADLADDELLTVTHAIAKYNTFNEKWDNPVAAFNNNQLTLKDDFNVIKKAYIDVYFIVVANWDEYDKETQTNLKEWHAHAKELDDLFHDAIKAQKYLDAAKQAIEYAGVAINIFVKSATR